MKCIGCGIRETKQKHTYCNCCRRRLAQGWQCLEADSLPHPNETKRGDGRGFFFFWPTPRRA